MNRAVTVLLTAVMLLMLSGCCFKTDSESIIEKYDSFTEWFGHFQITRDCQLIGERRYGFDRYTGNYTADCRAKSGRDVIFGGASVKERKIKLSASVTAEDGSATVRIRIGEDVEEHKFTSSGFIEKELTLNGGSYIMIDYGGFSGTVMLTSEYITE